MHHVAVRGVFDSAASNGRATTVLDTAASVEHLLLGTAQAADALLVVVEPIPFSLLTGLRTVRLARDLGIEHVSVVVNKVRDEADEVAAREYAARHELPIAALIPEDPAFHAADRAEGAPLDFGPDSPGVRSIAALARSLVA